MKRTKNIGYIIFTMVLAFLIISISSSNNLNIKDIIQANISQGLRTVKITEEKIKIDDRKLSISIKMPEIHCQDEEVQRYINSYIRKNINEFINTKRQNMELKDSKENIDVSINYGVAFEDGNLLNVIIYKNTNVGKKDFILEKESYIFDLKTGQRIYLDHFLKDNKDYQEVLSKYIYDYIKKHNLNVDKSKIKINKNTNYIISDGGIVIYFNPYRSSKSNAIYEFKVPVEIFKNKIRTVGTNRIVANVDTQTLTKNTDYINSIINIPIIITSNKDIEKYINDKIRNDIMDFYNQAQQEAKEYLGKIPSKDEKFVANVNYEVKKNSDNVLSIIVRYYKYSGGAHGYYEDVSYNLDMINGKLLQLNDLFKQNSEYKNVIDSEIRKQIENIIKNDKEYKDVYQFEGIKPDNKFYIQDDNIVIYFDLYEIAPYAAGQPEFFINASVINHILKDQYVNIFK